MGRARRRSPNRHHVTCNNLTDSLRLGVTVGNAEMDGLTCAKVGVLGSGAWGLALARLFSRQGHDVTVWSESAEVVARLEGSRTIPLPGDPELPREIKLTTEVSEACADKDVVVFVTSSRFVRSMAARAAEWVRPDAVLVCATKGLEEGSMDTMTEVIADEMSKARPGSAPAVVALSGPSHAEEVAFDMPTAIVAASEDEAAALLVQRLFSNEVLRVYTSSDVRGVELCGAIKNVIALACGIARGLGYGDNSFAALVTRGVAEMRRLGTALGCDPETFFGLACTGDLVVTAGSLHSRNLRCGKLIGSGVPVEEARAQVGAVVEGLNALPAVIELSRKLGVEMPICDMVDRVVSGQIGPEDATELLMGRELKPEGPEAYEE